MADRSSGEHATAFVVEDMTMDDLEAISWSGSPSHIRNVAMQLERRDRGEVDYLVVRGPDGAPVCKGSIDWQAEDGAGTIWQLATRSEDEGRGHATRLIADAERRIGRRGLHRAVLAVEPDNLRARSLYEHLGYRPFGERQTGWEYELEDGTPAFYSTTVIEMEKLLWHPWR